MTGTAGRMGLARHLLWIDCIAAVLAGALMLSLTDAIARLYAMPVDWLRVIGIVNLLYACLSGALAMRSRRPRPLIAMLSIANGIWATACIGMAVAMAATATAFGMAHLLGEGLFVGSLAALEWRWRERLATS